MGLKSWAKKQTAICWLYDRMRYVVPRLLIGSQWDAFVTRRKFKKVFGRELDLENPRTLNEKIQWLKLNVHENYHTTCADKLAAREVWKPYGEDGLVPLLFTTDDWCEVTLEHLPDVPCIVKCNSGSGQYEMVRDKKKVNIRDLQGKCKRWMMCNYYYRSQEWQYKNIRPCIMIEQLLLDRNGHIPNDYKLHFINGELEFVYCSIDREGENYRSIYSPDWKRLNIEWVAPQNHKGTHIGADIPCPPTFSRMLSIGKEIAKRFRYVRVDFYDVDGKLYYGEITLHHGSGFDTFEPPEYDTLYGNKLRLK